MTALVTTAGAALFSALQSGTAPAATYGTLLFGSANDEPTATDITSDVGERVPVTATATVARDNRDVRNTGRGANTWTWAFEFSAPSTPWVASNVALGVNPLTTGGDLAIHSRQVVSADPYRTLLVWVNLSGTSAATVVDGYDDDPVQAARLRGNGSRADVLHGGPGSSTLRPGHVNASVRPGEPASLRGRLYGDDLQPLTPSDVRFATRKVESYVPDSGKWVAVEKSTVDDCMLSRARGELSALFPYRGGFNFQAVLESNFTLDGLDKRVTYELNLFDGTSRTLYHDVRVSGR